MPKITACLMLKNEADKLEDLLRNLQGFADEVVAIDHGSTDGTHRILQAHGVRFKIVPEEKEWINKDWTILFNMADDGWILRIDADERLPEETKRRLKSWGSELGDDRYDVVWLWSMHYMNPKRYYAYGFWQPHIEPRFFRTRCKPKITAAIHSQPIFSPDAIHCISGLEYDHLYYLKGKEKTATDHKRYIEVEHEQKGTPSKLSVLASYPFWWFNGLIWKGGFLDGVEGVKANLFLADYFARARGLKR
jgi:glycosyltransferase involved in cell wall biosynthesis